MKICWQMRLPTLSAGPTLDVRWLIVFPICAAAAVVSALCLTMGGSRDQHAQMCIAAGMGLIAWSFIEYGLHRFVLHGMWPFNAWHATHHARPIERPGDLRTFAGAALIVSLALLPASICGTSWPGIGASLGLLAGYGTYVAAHHAIHHSHCGCAWLRQRKFHHALHHDGHRRDGYYGVTSCFWDRLLGTCHPQEF
jgi:cyclopropane-fatty-acyl-phospholipid synthase